MSFDVSLRLESCTYCCREQESVYVHSLTHNVNSIVDLCLVDGGATVAASGDKYYKNRSWGRLDGWRARDAIPILRIALDVANDQKRETEFRSIEPENRWGTLENVRECLAVLLDTCERYPNGIIEANG